MEIRVLRYFLTVALEENITKAAEALHITQPTLSRQLRELEDEVGVKLFVRGTKKLSLTQEGWLLRRRAKEIIELTDKAAQELLKQEKELEGRISIGCGEMKAVETLAEFCGGFRKRHPHVSFDFYTAAADAVQERIDRGLLDLGLLLETAHLNLEKYGFFRLSVPEEWCVLLRPTDPLAKKAAVTAEDLRNLPLILPPGLSTQSALAGWFGRDFDRLNAAYTGSLTANSAILSAKGFGYALVLNDSLPPVDQEKLTSRLLDPPLASTVLLVWKRGQALSPAMEKFMEFLKEEGGIPLGHGSSAQTKY